MAKFKYITCGKKAFSFSDTFTGFSVSKNQVIMASLKHTTSGKFKRALAAGHIKEVDEETYQKYLSNLGSSSAKEVARDKEPENLSLAESLGEKTKSMIADYYKENYEVNDDDLVAFSNLKKSEMIDYLVELEEDE